MGENQESETKEINWGWLQAAWYPGGLWFRLWGWGLRCVDHRRHPALFSERIGKKRALHVGAWCFAVVGGEPTPRSFKYPVIGNFPWRPK